jgi:hypothetical protein
VRGVLCGRRQVVQQGGLADPRLSQDDQDAGGSGTRLLHQGGKLRAFALAAG